MAEEKTKMMNPLMKLNQEIEAAPNVRSVILLAQDRFKKNYELVTGKKDGDQRFQSELLNYLEIVNDKPALQNVEKFSHFAAVMKAATTGLSFASDGHLYPVPIGGKVKVQIGAHGKKEMLRMMKEIKFVNEAVVVMKGDHFVMDKLSGKILEHRSTKESSTANKLEDVFGVYTRLEWNDGRITDTFVGHDELVKAKSKSKNLGPGSVWEEWPLEMVKKVSYHRAKKNHYRLPDGVVDFGGETAKTDEGDDNDTTVDVPHSEVQQPSNKSEEPIATTAEVVSEPVKPEASKSRKKEEPPVQKPVESSKPSEEKTGDSFLD
jgi:recombinational DNA repair protein RecT